MRRRQVIALLGGALAAWPFGARAQPSARRIGVLMSMTEDDPNGHAAVAAFERGLAERGWTGGHEVRIEYRWAIDSPDRIKAAIAEYQALSSDVVMADTSRTLAALRQAMPATPIVFTMIYEPVAQGFVRSLSHPGGNATGFTAMEASIGAKWVELLSEMAPTLARVAYMCNPSNPGPLQPYAAAEEAARKRAVAIELAAVHGAADIEAAMTTLARAPGGGLIVPPDGFLFNHIELIIKLVARDRLPAISGLEFFAAYGGLASYGVEPLEQYRQAAAYVDRILRGEKPGDLPVQEPTQYALAINLKTAEALGLDIPPMLLAAAAEVVE